MESKPVIARLKPCLIRLKAGRTYLWCRCGRSGRQPFCDGSHEGTGFEPLEHKALVDGEEVLFCGCKHTRTPPFCDGSHSNLPGGSPLDDPRSAENLAIPAVEAGSEGRRMLNNGCFTCSPAAAALETRGALRYATIISAELGALYHTLLYLRLPAERSPVMSCGDRHALLFVRAGHGSIVVSGRPFAVKPTDSVHVRPSEAFQLEAAPGSTLEAFLSTWPHGPIEWPNAMPQNFEAAFPDRVASVDAQQRHDMGPRFFQHLIDRRFGCGLTTEFIGHIPQSKAAAHRHLYEEAILILSGEGWMWTEDRKARVAAGDVIYLPRKQLHSLEATAPGGMDVLGVIYPGDNPGINY
jgi:CDGSH-type Zn-finger protein/mannose-6-phosphate isomerase-like protein (cupin superfamily)